MSRGEFHIYEAIKKIAVDQIEEKLSGSPANHTVVVC
jgi:hypothetical protein